MFLEMTRVRNRAARHRITAYPPSLRRKAMKPLPVAFAALPVLAVPVFGQRPAATAPADSEKRPHAGEWESASGGTESQLQ